MNTQDSIAIASKCIAADHEYQTNGSLIAYMEFFETRTQIVKV